MIALVDVVFAVAAVAAVVVFTAVACFQAIKLFCGSMYCIYCVGVIGDCVQYVRTYIIINDY